MWSPRIKLKIDQIIIQPFLNQNLQIPTFTSPTEISFKDSSLDTFNSQQINHTMNRQQQTNSNTNQTNTPTSSKITRTNPYNQTSSRANNSSKTNNDSSIFQLLPNKVSSLGSSVLFQDMDKKKEKNNPPTNTSSVDQSATIPVKTEECDKSMGLITNVFMGATSKFVKVPMNPSTPIKNIFPNTSKQEEQEDLPVNLPISKVVQRNRQLKSTIERQEGQSTERGQGQTGRKIERKQPANRQLKFIERKEEKVEQQAQVKIDSAKKNNVFKQQTQTQEQFQRVYQQPFQRANPYSRSRIISQTPKVEQSVKVDKTKIQQEKVKPYTDTLPSKVEVKPVVNRLINSRLQSNLSQSKSIQQQVIKQNDFSKVQIKSNLSKEVQQPSQKEQIKPKPYSRSFVTKKTQNQFNKLAVSTVVPSTIIVQSTKQHTQSNKKQQQAIQLKKSYCISFIFKRLIQDKLINAFLTLKANKHTLKIKNNNEGLLLLYAISNIVKHKEGNLVRVGLENIKKRFTTPYITSLKGYTDLPTGYKNTAITILDKLYLSKIRSIIQLIKLSQQTLTSKIRSFTVIQTLFKKKTYQYIKLGWQSLKSKHQIQNHRLNQFSTIFAQVSKNKVAIAFAKLTAVKTIQVQPISTPKQQKLIRPIPIKIQQTQPINTTNSALIDKLQKLKKSSLSISEEINTIKTSLQHKKTNTEDEKGTLVQKITVLQLQNGQANNEIQIKKHRNDQIKKEMQNMTSSRQPKPQDQPQQKSNKLEIITQLYISNFKNQEETLFIPDLINKYQLHPQDSTLIFRQWQSILHNVELKKLIAGYEGVQGRQNKGRVNLIGQQTLVSKLIRSYIKEQYFWNWIHLSAQNI